MPALFLAGEPGAYTPRAPRRDPFFRSLWLFLLQGLVALRGRVVGEFLRIEGRIADDGRHGVLDEGAGVLRALDRGLRAAILLDPRHRRLVGWHLLELVL